MNRDVALRYSNIGVRVFPCDGRKKPLTANGFRDATRDPHTITEWWTEHPDALVGTPDFDVVDVDLYKHGATETFTRLEAHLADARVVMRTPRGGKQFYYEGGSGAPQSQNTPALPGVDTRAKGRGYTILHGPGYEFEQGAVIDLCALSPFPEEVAALLKHSSNGVTSVAGVESELFRRIVEELDAKPTRRGNYAAPCPLPHATGNKSKTSLAIWPGGPDGYTVKCSAGCDFRDIKAELETRLERSVEPVQRTAWKRLSEVKVESVEWMDAPLWQRSAFHLLVGRKLVGKSTLLAELVARITSGRLGDKRDVIWVASEDSYSKDILPRLIAAGGDGERVLCNDLSVEGAGWFQLPDGCAELRELAHELDGVAAIIIDPLTNHLDEKAQAGNTVAIRHGIAPLNSLADELNCAVIGVHHFTEKPLANRSLLGGVLDSSAWVQVPRVVVAVVQDDDDSEARVVQAVSNRAPVDGAARSFSLVGRRVEGAEAPLVQWNGNTHKDVETLLSKDRDDGRRGVPTQAIRDLILRELATGDKTRRHLDSVCAEELGVSDNAVYERGLSPLKQQGQIRVYKDGMHGEWCWGEV